MENKSVFLGCVFLVPSGTRIGRMGMTRKWTEKMLLVILLYKVALAFESVDESLKCETKKKIVES